MNENPETVVTQAEMDAALNPEIFSGAELRALKKLDEKNGADRISARQS